MNKEKLKGLQSFLKDDIWRVTEDEVSKSRGILYNAIKIATLSIREFTQGRIINKASALTYSTLLSSIPILAILFAIARGFGFSNLLETQFRSGLEGQSAAAETVLGLIDSYLIHAKSGVFIGVGLIMLFWTILSLTYNIERTFNYIWQVKKPRTLYRKMTDYFSILLLLPLLIVLSSGISIFTANEVYGQAYSFHTHVGNVHRAICVYAQYKGKNQICYHTRYYSRYCFSGIPIFIYRKPDMGFALQCHLR